MGRRVSGHLFGGLSGLDGTFICSGSASGACARRRATGISGALDALDATSAPGDPSFLCPPGCVTQDDAALAKQHEGQFLAFAGGAGLLAGILLGYLIGKR